MSGRSHSWQHDPRPVLVDPHGLGVLDHDTCLRLLSEEGVGRLGLSVGSLPVVLPVNYVLDGEVIVFRSADGDKLTAARRNTVACFEIDHVDRFEHTGWSVLATGRLRLAPDDGDPARVERLPVVPWAVPGAEHVVELPIELLSGRTIRHP